MKRNEWRKLWRGTRRGNVDIETRWTQKIAEIDIETQQMQEMQDV